MPLLVTTVDAFRMWIGVNSIPVKQFRLSLSVLDSMYDLVQPYDVVRISTFIKGASGHAVGD